MAKKIILCADDFGQDPHISQAILSLAHNRRISAMSCMTTGGNWKREGSDLKPLHNQVDIGLHFNLTHGQGEKFRPLRYWLLRSLLRHINKQDIEQRLQNQLDSFIDVMGHPPDFIDGHQHVHTFPVIRDVVIQVIKERFPKHRPYVRSINPMLESPESKIKSLVTKMISFRFSAALDAAGISYNPQFGGMYSLDERTPYRQCMIQWLHQAVSGTLIMCHPGLEPKQQTDDSHTQARIQEYQYLSSEFFLEDCLKANVELGRF
jgi:predicted glycoside hydrolase/deacetylase ChbG (UPF0249 family)